MKVKLPHIILASAVWITLQACSFSSSGSSGSGTGSLSVSFVQKADMNISKSIRAKVMISDMQTFDVSLYKSPYNDNSQGSLVGSYSPENLVSTVSELSSTNTKGCEPLLTVFSVMDGPSSGIGICPTFDMCYSRNIINKTFDELSILSPSSFTFTAFTRYCGSDSTGNFEMLSRVCVDLGEDYKNVTFPDEISGLKSGNLHFFNFADLIPLEGSNRTSVMSMFFSDKITEPMILNPDGSYASFNPALGVSGNATRGLSGYVLYLPSEDVLMDSDMELVFSWDLKNLIEVYDNNTPSDQSDDLITLRLDNPFPVSLYSVENTQSSLLIEDDEDNQNPPDVNYLDIRTWNDYYDGNIVYVKWVNPPITDLSKITIIKKTGNAPRNETDGEVVYSADFPVFKDKDIQTGNTYYYFVIVEDTEGKKSNGLVTSIDVK